MLNQIDKGNPVDVVFLDFSKAFYTVPHKRLMNKVRGHGIRGKIAQWIEEWLSSRMQRVQINGEKSQWERVLGGVPQGSVLGPLLFLLCVNDLEWEITCHTSKFADTTLGQNVKSLEGNIKLLRELDKVIAWAKKWEM